MLVEDTSSIPRLQEYAKGRVVVMEVAPEPVMEEIDISRGRNALCLHVV